MKPTRQLSSAQIEAIESFKRLLKRGGFEARFPPFENISICVSALKEYDLDATYGGDDDTFDVDPKAGDTLRQIIAILGVLQLYIGSIATILLVHNLGAKGVKQQCAISLLSGMATDLGAIRTLILEGYDVQARSIARSFGERLDMLVATQLDLAFAREFVANSEIDDANAFWQRSVARGKLEKRVSKRITRLSPSKISIIDEEWRARRKETSRWLSTATHPSYLSGWFAILPDLVDHYASIATFDGETGLFGKRSAISIATGRAIFARTLELWFLIQCRKPHLVPEVSWAKEMLDIINGAEKFIGRAIGESYVAPHLDIWKIYYGLLGYKLEKVE